MVMVAPNGTTVALKMLDGSGRAATAVALRLLEREGALARIRCRRCDDEASAVGLRRRAGCRGDPPRILEALHKERERSKGERKGSHDEDLRPHRSEEQRVPRGTDARGRPRSRSGGARGVRAARRGRRLVDAGCRIRGGRSDTARRRRRGVGARRAAAQGQGADRERVRLLPRRPRALHLSAPRRGPSAHRPPRRGPRDRDRVRDRPARRRRPAAARAR